MAGTWGSHEGHGILYQLGSERVPAHSSIGVGVSPVSLVTDDLLADRVMGEGYGTQSALADIKTSNLENNFRDMQ